MRRAASVRRVEQLVADAAHRIPICKMAFEKKDFTPPIPKDDFSFDTDITVFIH